MTTVNTVPNIRHELYLLLATFVAVAIAVTLYVNFNNHPWVTGLGSEPWARYYYRSAAAVSFFILLSLNSANWIGSVIVSIVLGWLYWPVFVYLLFRRKYAEDSQPQRSSP